MAEPDYSVYYRRFHDDSEAHATAMARATAELIGPYLPADRATPIADIGCGYGFALRALRDLGYTDILGLEASDQQAARCRQAGFNVEVTKDSAVFLRAHPHGFGLVLLMDVLEHIPIAAQIEFLGAIHASLVEGGRLFITTPNANAILASRWRYNDHTHHCSFTEHSLYFVLKNAGFAQVAIESQKGIGRMPRRLWRRDMRERWRRWFVRWCWLQVFKAELPWEKIDDISFELNLRAVATK